MIKKITYFTIIFMFSLIISSFAALGATEDLSFNGELDRIISSDQIAEFNLIITNNDAPSDLIVEISELEGWDVELNETELEILKGDEKTLNFKITPPQNAEARTYSFTLSILNSNETIVSKTIRISIADIIVPLSVEINLPSEAKPAQDFPIKATFKNKDVQKYNGVKLEFDSELFEQPFLTKKDFDELAEKEVVKTFTIKPYVAAGDYDFVVYSTINQIRSEILRVAITVQETGSMFIEESSEDTLFKTMDQYVITNKGNTKLNDQYKVLVSATTRFFKSFNPDPDFTVTEIGKYYYGYNIELEPEQSITITKTFSIIPFLIAIIVLTAAAVWFYRKRKITIRKEIIPGEVINGKRTMRVRLIVKNKQNKRLKKVNVTDFVPMPLKLVHAKYSTLRPDVIKKQKISTKLVWKIESLAPGEERVLTYNAVASLKILGKIALPPAIIEARINRRKEKIVSNAVALRGRA